MGKNKVGFTLIELVIVIGILAAVISVAGFAKRGYRRTLVVQECKQIAEQMNAYYHNNGSYPISNFQQFLNDPGYFSKKLENPYGDGFSVEDSGTTIRVYANPKSNGIYYEFKKSKMKVEP